MESGIGSTRREVLWKMRDLIAAAILARWVELDPARADAMPSGVKAPVPTISAVGTENLHYFSADEKETLATVADLIIPTDEVSPGARAAGVHEWIDFVVANSPPKVQEEWRAGLRALDRLSSQNAGQPFLKLPAERQRELLEELAQREESPTTPGEHFFSLVKEAVVNGYYTSEIGLIKDLGYLGGTYVAGPDVACPVHKIH